MEKYTKYRINHYDGRDEVYYYYDDIFDLRAKILELEESGEEEICIEELVTEKGFEYQTARLYMCQNCGGGFLSEEMDFDVEENDCDLCKNCNHQTFNEAPYGD